MWQVAFGTKVPRSDIDAQMAKWNTACDYMSEEEAQLFDLVHPCSQSQWYLGPLSRYGYEASGDNE